MKTLLCSLALGALANLATAQQSPLRNQAVVADGFVLLQHDDDGSLVGRGDAYRARFEAEGMRFEPALPTAPRLQHLALAATRAGRGELAPLPKAAAPAAEGLRVHYRRGAVDEVYDVRSTGVEQSFVFDSLPPGQGDLVVELQVEATLPVHETGRDHVVYAGEHGGVRIGGVVGIDAHGMRAAGTMTAHDGRLELRLPAAFVSRAALPLVLDPVVNTFAMTAPSAVSALQDAELSYDASTGKYAIVYCINLASSAREVRFLLTNGSPLGNTPVFGLVTSAATDGPVSVANCNLRNCFVVAWTETMTYSGTPPTYELVRARLLQPTGALGPVTAIAGIPSLPRSQVQLLSGSQTNSAVLKFVCIRGGTGLPVGELWTLTVDASGALIAANPRDVSAPARACTAIAISQVEDLDQDFLVVWSETNSTLGQYLVAGATFDAAGVARSNQWRYVANGPAVQMRVDGDGLLQSWAVAVGFDGGTASYPAPSFFSLWMDPTHPGTLVDGGITALPHNNGSRSFPIASTPRLIHTVHWEFLAGRCTSSLPNCETTTFGVHNHEGCTLCNSESRLHTLLWAALLRPRAYGDPAFGADAVKVAYHNVKDWVSNQGQPISLADFTAADGAVTDLGGSCGPYAGAASSQCARVGGTEHEALLRGLPQGASAFLVVGTERADLGGCGSCVLVPDPFSSFVFGPLQPPNGNPAVSKSFPIPADTGLMGFRLYEQWLVRNTTNPGCATWLFDMSNALRITIQ